MNFTNLSTRLAKVIADHSPVILTAIGVTGTVLTAYLAGKAAFRVGKDVNAGHYENLMADKMPEFYDAKALVATYWKEFIPAVAVGTLTVTCIIMANRVGDRRTAALAAAYGITEKAFDEYKAKVIEKVGQKKEQAYRDEIAQERVDRQPLSREVVILGGGDVLCYDAHSGRYFHSDMESLKKAQNDTNYQILNDFYASLTDFYGRVGLTKTQESDDIGWNSDKILDLQFSTVLSEDGRPCLSFLFSVSPIRRFSRIS